jgi:hypothetical protein
MVYVFGYYNKGTENKLVLCGMAIVFYSGIVILQMEFLWVDNKIKLSLILPGSHLINIHVKPDT